MNLTCPGFRFAGLSAGIKPGRTLDLGFIVADKTANAAALFTKNKVVAAPIKLSRRHLQLTSGKIRSLVVNSGNANACTGKDGDDHARLMAKDTAGILGIEPKQVLVASTGVIGAPLPIDQVQKAIARAKSHLSPKNFELFADAILTTDLRRKVARRRLELGGARVTMIGCTKGAGMISPDMATTLTFIMTDASLPVSDLQTSLSMAAENTFNAITVDGDTSTNDMLLVMTSGSAKNHRLSGKAKHRFTNALAAMLDKLARDLMREGEGVHHVVSVRVVGAKTARGARQIARTIANSPLVKTAIAGRDPNWGRIFAAAGRAGVPLQPGQLDLQIGGVLVAESGCGIQTATVEERARGVMEKQEYEIVLDLHQGTEEARILTCDLSHEYVSINADYRS